MKTYPVMLPCHGGEDVEIASIAETEDGRCTILETTFKPTTRRTRWKSSAKAGRKPISANRCAHSTKGRGNGKDF